MLNKGLQHYKKNADDINEELKNLPDDFLEEDKAREYLVRFLRTNIGLTCYWMSGVDLFPFQEIAIKTMFKRDYTLGIWCKHPDEYVLTKNGHKKIKNVKVGEFVRSRRGLNKVLDKWENPEEDGLEIITQSGDSFKAKKGHKTLIYDTETCDFVFKEIDKLTKEDYIVVKHGTNNWGNNSINFNFGIGESSLLFFILGYMIGDGYIDKNGVHICTENIEIFEKSQEFCDLYNINKYHRERKKGFYEISFFSRTMVGALKDIGFDPTKKAFEKTIPDSLLLSSKENIGQLLSGLFSSDGFCSILKEKRVKTKNSFSVKCGLKNTSLELLRQVKMILNNMGVTSNLRYSGTSKNGRKYYDLVLNNTSKNLETFKKYVGFKILYKQKNLDLAIASCGQRDYQNNLVPELGKYLRKYEGDYKKVTNRNGTWAKNFSINRFYFLENISLSTQSIIKKIQDEQCYFTKVKDINPIKTKSIDITVDNEENYVGNGIVHHNSRGLSKSFSTGVFAFLYAAFNPNSKIAIISKSFRQSREIFKKIEELANSKKGTLLAECLMGTPKHLNDEWSMQIGSSELKALPLGDGCLQVFDTHILTKNSYTNFASILPDNLDTKIDHQEFTSPNTQVWSNGKYRNSDQQFYNGIRDTKKIETKRGLKVESTLNHKFKTLLGLNISWKQADKYKVGDPILIDKSVRWHDGDTELTEDECYVFGAIIGDGSLTSSSYIGFATQDEEIVDYLRCGSPFNWVRHNDQVHWYGNGGNARKIKWLSKFGYSNKSGWDTTNKHIPQPILNSSKPKVAAFIRGLMDADGGVYAQTAKGGTSISICFYNTSEKLVRQLQFLLLHFGIVANITKRQRTADKRFGSVDWNSSWELHITGKDVLTFSQEIGFRLTRKKKALEDAIAKKKRWNSISDEQVPIDKNILVDFCKKNKVPQPQGNPYSSLIRASVINSKKYITKGLLKKFIEVYNYTEDPLLDSLRALIDPNIYFDTVYSIEEGRAPTADIHVPDGHEYTANGFFSHNSKLRGFRFNVLIIDELLLMPEKVINEVITPFLSTNKDPKKLHDVRELEDKLIKEGKMTEEDRFQPEKNKMIGLSSASYTFEPLYKTYKEYLTAITTGTEDGRELKPDKSNALKGSYAVLQLSYDYAAKRCAGLYDEALLSKAKNQMSKQQFDREFGAQFTDESGGFFNMKTMNDCTVVDGEYPTTEIIGDPSEEYILAIDPAFAENDSSDFFAMTVLKKVSDKKFMVVHAYAVAGGRFKDHVNYFAYLYTFFNIKFIIMDNAGGSTFLQFINQDKRFKEKPFKVIEKPNFNDVNDYQKQLRLAREEYNLTERRIVLYQTFNSDWIRRSNEILQANMDHKRIIFASAAEFIESEFSRQRSLNIPIEKLKFIGLTKKEKVNSLDDDDVEGDGVDILDESLSPEMAKDAKKVDLIERQGFLISLMKTQCAFIEVKTSDSGSQSFVLPQNLKNQKGPDRPRRDLYTVLLLGSWANKCYNDFKTFVDDEDDEGDFVPTEIKK